MPDDIVWEDIRHAYATSSMTIEELLTAFNISASVLRRRREMENWPPRNGLANMQAARVKRRETSPTPAAPKPATVEPDAPPPPAARSAKAKRGKSTTATGRKAVITRLSNAIDRKLITLERRMDREFATLDDLDDASAADIERDIRAIGQLIKNLEQATAHDATANSKTAGGAARKRGRDISAAELADEADRHRRELLNRLQRLVDAAKPSAGSDP